MIVRFGPGFDPMRLAPPRYRLGPKTSGQRRLFCRNGWDSGNFHHPKKIVGPQSNVFKSLIVTMAAGAMLIFCCACRFDPYAGDQKLSALFKMSSVTPYGTADQDQYQKPWRSLTGAMENKNKNIVLSDIFKHPEKETCQVIRRFDADGNLLEIAYRNKKGERVENSEGIAVSRLQYDWMNQPAIVMTHYDTGDRITEDRHGTAKIEFRFHFDENDQLEQDGVALTLVKLNQRGLATEISWYDSELHLTEICKNMAIVRHKYDEEGRIIEVYALNKDLDYAEADDGTVFYRQVFQNGHRVLLRYDRNDRLIESKKETVISTDPDRDQ